MPVPRKVYIPASLCMPSVGIWLKQQSSDGGLSDLLSSMPTAIGYPVYAILLCVISLLVLAPLFALANLLLTWPPSKNKVSSDSRPSNVILQAQPADQLVTDIRAAIDAIKLASDDPKIIEACYDTVYLLELKPEPAVLESLLDDVASFGSTVGLHGRLTREAQYHGADQGTDRQLLLTTAEGIAGYHGLVRSTINRHNLAAAQETLEHAERLKTRGAAHEELNRPSASTRSDDED